MAIATAVIGAGTTIYGIAKGAEKSAEGRKMQREAQKKIDEFEWDELVNPFKDLQVSRLGADLQVEQNNVTEASMVDALRGGGNRAIVGGLGRVQANSNLVNARIGADLDQQQKAIDMAVAQDEARIRGINYEKQANELAGYGSLLNIGMNTKYQGQADTINGIGALGQVVGAYGTQVKDALKSPTETTASNVTPITTTGAAVKANLSQNIINGGVNYEAARNWTSMISSPDYNKVYGFNLLGNG